MRRWGSSRRKSKGDRSRAGELATTAKNRCDQNLKTSSQSHRLGPTREALSIASRHRHPSPRQLFEWKSALAIRMPMIALSPRSTTTSPILHCAGATYPRHHIQTKFTAERRSPPPSPFRIHKSSNGELPAAAKRNCATPPAAQKCNRKNIQQSVVVAIPTGDKVDSKKKTRKLERREKRSRATPGVEVEEREIAATRSRRFCRKSLYPPRRRRRRGKAIAEATRQPASGHKNLKSPKIGFRVGWAAATKYTAASGHKSRQRDETDVYIGDQITKTAAAATKSASHRIPHSGSRTPQRSRTQRELIIERMNVTISVAAVTFGDRTGWVRADSNRNQSSIAGRRKFVAE